MTEPVRRRGLRLLLVAQLWLVVWGPGPATAQEIYVAVAANFLSPLQALVRVYEQKTGSRLRVSSGSTGKLYAQIVHGAPFDVFFAADSRRPSLLEEAGRALPGSRFTYAIGRLALWSRDPSLVKGPEVLSDEAYRHLAMANPKIAPYGRAAQQVLKRLGLWDRLRPRLVFGENVAQTFQFVDSGNAALGFVALSQVSRGTYPSQGSRFVIPAEWHGPIRQQAVVIGGPRQALGQAFADFVRGAQGKAIIADYGYAAPSEP